MKILPAIDLRGGCVVRLVQGDYGRETRYADDPLPLASSYRQAGADWLHLVDLDGARSGRLDNLAAITRLARDSGLKLQCGGGVRDEASLKRLFEAGVSRVVVGSLAMREPERVRGWLADYGSERLCLALDVRADAALGWQLAAAGWTEATGLGLRQGLEAYAGSGLRHVLVTDIGRDGTLEGPNLELYRELATQWPELSCQASGGVSSLGDLAALRATGIGGVVIGRALLEGRFSAAQALAA